LTLLQVRGVVLHQQLALHGDSNDFNGHFLSLTLS
jgi:hypothetical protein